jgi:hypothetical protein
VVGVVGVGAGCAALGTPLVVAHDIRPEFDHFRTDDALGRHGEAASDRGANGSPGLRIVEVGDGGSGQIANNVA